MAKSYVSAPPPPLTWSASYCAESLTRRRSRTDPEKHLSVVFFRILSHSSNTNANERSFWFAG